jgi:hypothetical protein
MRTFDGLVLPISFSPQWRHMAEMNIATKMSEYVGSGVPTLVIGPSYAAMVRFLEPTGAALLVTNPSSTGISNALGQLRDPSARSKVLAAATRLSHSNLSQSAMRKIWRRCTGADEAFTAGKSTCLQSS